MSIQKRYNFISKLFICFCHNTIFLLSIQESYKKKSLLPSCSGGLLEKDYQGYYGYSRYSIPNKVSEMLTHLVLKPFPERRCLFRSSPFVARLLKLYITIVHKKVIMGHNFLVQVVKCSHVFSPVCFRAWQRPTLPLMQYHRRY